MGLAVAMRAQADDRDKTGEHELRDRLHAAQRADRDALLRFIRAGKPRAELRRALSLWPWVATPSDGWVALVRLACSPASGVAHSAWRALSAASDAQAMPDGNSSYWLAERRRLLARRLRACAVRSETPIHRARAMLTRAALLE